MQNFDQLKAMSKMVKWVKKKRNKEKENLRRNLASKRKRKAARKVASISRKRNRK